MNPYGGLKGHFCIDGRMLLMGNNTAGKEAKRFKNTIFADFYVPLWPTDFSLVGYFRWLYWNARAEIA